MRFGNKLDFAVLIALIQMTGCIAHAAAPAPDPKTVALERLNVAARNFHSTSADFEQDTIETDPVYDKDVQTGVVYYERTAGSFKMGVHVTHHRDKSSAKTYTFVDGVFKLFEPGIDQVTTYKKAGKFESYAILGFGASGKDLEAKWDVTDLGSETLLDGKTSVKTEKLGLVAKDPEVRKSLKKVTIWVDLDRAVSLKQVLEFSSGITQVALYSNIKVNQSIPGDAFTLNTNKSTVYQTQ
jgi:outer membrane lipoprotein-sorting protein